MEVRLLFNRLLFSITGNIPLSALTGSRSFTPSSNMCCHVMVKTFSRVIKGWWCRYVKHSHYDTSGELRYTHRLEHEFARKVVLIPDVHATRYSQDTKTNSMFFRATPSSTSEIRFLSDTQVSVTHQLNSYFSMNQMVICGGWTIFYPNSIDLTKDKHGRTYILVLLHKS